MLAYTFQICNLKVIGSSIEGVSDNLQRLIETVKKRVAESLNDNVKKHCLIFSYNYLKNELEPQNRVLTFISFAIELALMPQSNSITIKTEL